MKQGGRDHRSSLGERVTSVNNGRIRTGGAEENESRTLRKRENGQSTASLTSSSRSAWSGEERILVLSRRKNGNRPDGGGGGGDTTDHTAPEQSNSEVESSRRLTQERVPDSEKENGGGGERRPGTGSRGDSFMHDLRTAPDERHWRGRASIKRPRSLLHKFRLLCGKIVEHPTVQVVIISLIVVNAIILGVGTFDFVTEDETTSRVFDAIDETFLTIFTVELGLQLLYRGLSLFQDGWLVFDFVIIVASWSLESLQIIRAFRVFRAFRLITRIGHLRELIAAIGAVMPRMYAIFMLLLLVFYVFAVLFTQLFGELDLSDNFFGSLDASLFSCMQMMTLEWADIAREVMEQDSWAWAPILSFISVTGFIVFNLIVAVVCDAVAVTSENAYRMFGYYGHQDDESDAMILNAAQERISELADQVESMKAHHFKMQQSLGILVVELQNSMAAQRQLEQRGSLAREPSGDENDAFFDASENDSEIDEG